MSFDGYFMKALILELTTVLKHGRIKKITQTAKDAFVFSIYNQSKEHNLYFDLNPSSSHLSINNQVFKNEQKSQFLMTLKKHLESGLIKNIRQHQLDRVLLIDIQSFDPIFGPTFKTLVFEVMGRSTNLILLDQDDFIIDAYYKHIDPERRSIVNQAKFSFFPSFKLMLDESNYDLLLAMDSPKAISNQFMGVSNELALFFYEHKYQIKPWALQVSPTLYKGKKTYYHAYDLLTDELKQPYDSLSELLNDYYQIDDAGKKDQLSQIIDNQIKKYEQKKINLNKDYDQNKDYETYKNQADFIYSSGMDLKQKRGTLEHLTLDETKSLNENAQFLYQRYHKYKKSLEPIKNQLAITGNYLDYFKDIKSNLSFFNQSDYNDLIEEFKQMGLIKKDTKQPKNKKKTTHLLTIKQANATIFVGKSSLQNDYLTHEVAHSNDLWFHVTQGPGAHVVLRGEKDEENIRLAAMLAAYYSPFRESSSVAVDYTQIRNIKKIKGRPGYYVTYTHQKTIYIDINKELIESL